MTFNFDDQKLLGEKGEALFKEDYPMFAKQYSKVYDFVNKYDPNITLELKTESRVFDFSIGTRVDYDPDLSRTLNIFFEFISCDIDNSPGGVWRSKINNVTHAVHLFLYERTYFWFNPQTIVPWLEEYIATYRPELKKVKNRPRNDPTRVYSTRGYAIPIRDIPSHLYTKIDIDLK